MSQAEVLHGAVAMLNAAGIPYMVVGSYASAFHGEPRMTRDIDVVIDPDSASIELLVDLVDRDRFYVGDAVAAFHARSMFNLIEPSTGWKVDLVLRKDRPFSRQEFERRFADLLTDRLNRLVDTGVLAKVPYQERPLRHEYRLTEKGADLSPALIALMQWGDRWYHADGPPTVLEHSTCGTPLHHEVRCESCDEHVPPTQIRSRNAPTPEVASA